jgi:hypothetical protein
MWECINLNHDYENIVVKWRAEFRCPKCNEDVTMHYLYLQQAWAFN